MGGPVKGRADYFAPGDYNAACSMCGRKRKASELVRNWQGLYRCPEHNEPRQPQDYARGVKENMAVPWAQTEQVGFVEFNPTFPLSIVPAAIQLQIGTPDLALESGGALETEGGSLLVLEGTRQASTTILLPAWVVIEDIAWAWLEGGADITIGSPTSLVTLLSTADYPTSGVLQVTVTSNVGAVATATANVST